MSPDKGGRLRFFLLAVGVMLYGMQMLLLWLLCGSAEVRDDVYGVNSDLWTQSCFGFIHAKKWLPTFLCTTIVLRGSTRILGVKSHSLSFFFYGTNFSCWSLQTTLSEA